MPSYNRPRKNTAYIFHIGLTDQSNTKVLKANPTLAAGDFKVSIDGGAFANLATLPTVTPAGGTSVKVQLSAAEMNGDNIVVTCIDAAGAEWCDQLINLQPANARALTGHEFVMTDSTTHAPITGATVTVARSIDGGAYASGTLGVVAEVGSGTYKLDIPAADLGVSTTLRYTAPGCDDLFETITFDD